jgi:preprotein translocase subunit Sec61beta
MNDTKSRRFEPQTIIGAATSVICLLALAIFLLSVA